jgi:hypothetical protein
MLIAVIINIAANSFIRATFYRIYAKMRIFTRRFISVTFKCNFPRQSAGGFFFAFIFINVIADSINLIIFAYTLKRNKMKKSNTKVLTPHGIGIIVDEEVFKGSERWGVKLQNNPFTFPVAYYFKKEVAIIK